MREAHARWYAWIDKERRRMDNPRPAEAAKDLWYRCYICPGLLCRGDKQAPWHLKCVEMGSPIQRNAGLELDPVAKAEALEQMQHDLIVKASPSSSHHQPDDEHDDQDQQDSPKSDIHVGTIPS